MGGRDLEKRQTAMKIRLTGKVAPAIADATASTAFEQHYRVSELSSLWGWSPKTIIRLLADEPAMRLDNYGTGKRKYEPISVPESIAARVYERRCHPSLQPLSSSRAPCPVKLLCDSNRRVPKQPADFFKRHTAG
jgi:hypothetical protein